MKKKAWIPEWSKGSDLSSDAVSFVGSNPTSCIFSHLNSKLLSGGMRRFEPGTVNSVSSVGRAPPLKSE